MAKTPEVTAAFALIGRNIDDVLDALTGLSAAELNWKPPVEGGNSAMVLATHVIGACQGHLLQTLCGQSIERVREEEFEASGDSVGPLREHWATVRGRIDAALEALDPAELERTHEHPILGPMSGHDLLMLAVRHSAEHLGHASLTRDLLIAQRG